MHEDFIAENRLKVEDHFHEIAKLEQQIQDCAALLEALKASGYLKKGRSRLVAEWKKITANPDVSHLAVIGDGLHVYTKPMVIEHEGKSYEMGSYIIRISKLGIISVWSESPTHPQGVPHPHIGKETGACFGNATEAIIRAATSHQYERATSYVLRWLRYGYAPQLTLVKIEEWPVVSKTPAVEPVATEEKQEVAI